MATWLTPEEGRALLELDPLPTAADDPTRVAWIGALDAACSYVEDKRSDLVAGDPPVFVASPSIKYGAAMLTNRMFARRSSPLGTAGYSEFGADVVLRHDPDIAKMLGIGTAGRFVFGAAGAASTEA